MILATDLARPLESLVFEDEGERRGALALAAADLLGQMADRVYLEKLLFLYYEFREAGIVGYDSAFDILKKTAGFYESTKARLDGPLGSVSTRRGTTFPRARNRGGPLPRSHRAADGLPRFDHRGRQR